MRSMSVSSSSGSKDSASRRRRRSERTQRRTGDGLSVIGERELGFDDAASEDVR